MRRDLAPETTHWAACIHDQVIGCASLTAHRGWCLRGVAVHPAWRGRGVGRALLEAIQTQQACPLWCNASAASVGFYERLGWLAVGPLFSMADLGPHQRMTWTAPSCAT